MMGIFNRFSDLFKAEDEYEDSYESGYEDDILEEEDMQPQHQQHQQSAPRTAVPPTRTSTGVGSVSALEMKVIKPERFEAVTQIGDHLLARRTVVLNLEETNKETVRRIIDFCSGVAFAIEGQIKRVANSTYIITPKNVEVSGDQSERDESARPQRELF